LAQYAGIDWSGFIGLRDVVAHGYYNLNPVKILEICTHEFGLLRSVVNRIIDDLQTPHPL
jgi:uncharacterized protein with HEPN domain